MKSRPTAPGTRESGSAQVPSPQHELYHDIFGSILDRTEMTPYLLLRSKSYAVALRQATRMLGNRGFDVVGADELRHKERARAASYVHQARRYLLDWLFPFIEAQLEALARLESPNGSTYRSCLGALSDLRRALTDSAFVRLVDEDPRHLLLVASSRRYPNLFDGYRGERLDIPVAWQQAACTMLKTAHLVKSIEEDSQDIHDYARLGMFLQQHGYSLDDLFTMEWDRPERLPDDEPAQRAFVKVSTFFHKLKESMRFDAQKGCHVFSSGDGVDVDIVEVKARLKSPESMFSKLGKIIEDEASAIRDILAITFLLKSRDDTLTLFHALQKRGVILQENTASRSITQTLFSSPDDMVEAVRRLTVALARSEGSDAEVPLFRLRADATQFFGALSINAKKNSDSSVGHRKFQCKIHFSLPIHRDANTGRILVPGTPSYAMRDTLETITQQHTLGVELRLSDRESWQDSEWNGEAHHDAYRFRQLLALANRLFRPMFHFPSDGVPQLREDQNRLFAVRPREPG